MLCRFQTHWFLLFHTSQHNLATCCNFSFVKVQPCTAHQSIKESAPSILTSSCTWFHMLRIALHWKTACSVSSGAALQHGQLLVDTALLPYNASIVGRKSAAALQRKIFTFGSIDNFHIKAHPGEGFPPNITLCSCKSRYVLFTM